GSVSGSDVELFPGIYSSFSLSNGGQAYFNPGVYTFTSSFDTNHGTMCVYGAADCLNNTCATTQWTTGSAQGDQWYYSCSQWGFWDSCTTICNRPSGLPTTGPTWYDTSTGSASSTPLNGVTIYLPSSASGLTEHGNGGKDGGQYLAAPNPCPGTGTYTSSSVSFPAGAAAATFNYTGLLAAQHGLPANLTSLMTYPSQDLSLLGECSQSQTLEVWPGEMTKPQHLHFLWYDLSSSENYLTGASGQDWYGIFYSPNANFKLRGAGKGAGGPPWITGQVVTDTVDWSGNSYADITYRPCGPGSTPCGSGTGSQLIQ
ncbi:MAG: hypothetical protein JOZ41_00555, partial [Chloroflexi bacterium]|nr:hypothetical protein [Chloroflexota bacterium]